MDDLTKIKGIGKAAAATLIAAGIDSFEKLAHDGVVGQHGIKVEWISEAAKLLHDNTEDAGGSSSGEGGIPPSLDAPAAGEVPQGPNTTESEAAGGDGDPAVPAGHEAWLALEEMGDEAAREHFPLTIAALVEWAAKAEASAPIVRIAAKRDGFRRAGMAHSKAPAEYPAERFTPAELEKLLAEPRLKVELV